MANYSEKQNNSYDNGLGELSKNLKLGEAKNPNEKEKKKRKLLVFFIFFFSILIASAFGVYFAMYKRCTVVFEYQIASAFVGDDGELDYENGDFKYNEKSVVRIKKGTVLSSMPTPNDYEGYEFVGWFIDEARTRKFDINKPLQNDENHIYAKYVAKKYNIYFVNENVDGSYAILNDFNTTCYMNKQVKNFNLSSVVNFINTSSSTKRDAFQYYLDGFYQCKLIDGSYEKLSDKIVALNSFNYKLENGCDIYLVSKWNNREYNLILEINESGKEYLVEDNINDSNSYDLVSSKILKVVFNEKVEAQFSEFRVLKPLYNHIGWYGDDENKYVSLNNVGSLTLKYVASAGVCLVDGNNIIAKVKCENSQYSVSLKPKFENKKIMFNLNAPKASGAPTELCPYTEEIKNEVPILIKDPTTEGYFEDNNYKFMGWSGSSTGIAQFLKNSSVSFTCEIEQNETTIKIAYKLNGNSCSFNNNGNFDLFAVWTPYYVVELYANISELNSGKNFYKLKGFIEGNDSAIILGTLNNSGDDYFEEAQKIYKAISE